LEKILLKVQKVLGIKLKFNSLKTKILVWFSVSVAIVLIFFSFSFYYYFNKSVENSIKNNLLNIAYKITNDKNYKSNAIIKIKPSNKQNIKFTIKDYGEYLKATLFFYANNKEFIITKKIDDKSEDIVDTMLVLEPVLLFLLIFLASKMIDKILIPIKNITKTSKEISINNFKNTISQNEEYELKELINSFNEMIKRLQNEVKSLDRFNTNVSHELKTPITIIKGEIAIALKKNRSAKYYQNSLISISQEINNIQKITDNLLLLTKYTKTNIIETFENGDLDTILLEVIEKYNPLLNQKNIKITLKIEHIKFKCNSQLLYHIFSNLIDNAIKYSPKNSNINISLYKNKKINFIIEDEGIGIDKNEISKITEEFYQINKSTKGFGLGLSIVKYGVLLHNGELKITSNKGLKVHIIF